MLKKTRRFLAFLLVMIVAVSLTSRLTPQIAAEELDFVDDDVGTGSETELEQQEAAGDRTEVETNEDQNVEQQSEAVKETTGTEQKIQKQTAQQQKVQEQETESSKETQEARSGISVQSVHIVTDPEQHFTADYRFYDEDEKTLLSEQILSAGEKLREPEHKEKAHKKFLGWFEKRDADWVKFEAFGTEEPEMTESRTISLYARYEEVYYVYYKASQDADSRIIFTQTYKNGEEISTETVPFHTPENCALIGWTTDPDSGIPQEKILISGDDRTLYPVLKEARWITFDTQGGSVTDPQYVLSGDVTEEPLLPARAGYQFDGWYTDQDCTSKFLFGNVLESDITLYAKWNPVTVTYTVVYWQEDPDDDGYSFKESVQKQGLTGSQTAAGADKTYKGFSVSTEKKTEQQTIAGDGSTVVHVYYDRNVYSIYFKERVWSVWDSSWQNIEKLTITAKYGADISTLWPSERYPGEYGSNWKVSADGSTYQGGIETMPLGGATFYKLENTGQKYRADYYTESLDGTGYVLHHSDQFQISGWGILMTSKEDYYDIKGFTVKTDGSPSSPQMGTYASWQEDFDRDTIGWKFYYTRNSYTIEFHNDGQVVDTKTYKFEADISGAGFTPDEPEGKEDCSFAGWYENELREGEPYGFVDRTMPANNLILYAKWVPVTYKVTFDLNGAKAEEQPDPESYRVQNVEKGQTAVKPEDPVRSGYKFTGWTRDGKPFHFNTQITADTTLTAQWISEAQYSITYDPNGALYESGAEAECVTDTQKYADSADAKVWELPAEWNAPSENLVFLGWSENADGSGKIYYGSDLYQMPAKDITLYAVWEPLRKTTLIYDYNGGTDSAGGSGKTVEIEVPNAKYEIALDGTGIRRDGYYFVGWSISAEGESCLQKGDVIQVDTIEEEKNILYAQWKKETPTPTGIRENAVPFAVMFLTGMGGAVLFRRPKRRKS